MKTIPKKYILLILSLYVTEFSGFAFFMEGFVSILRKQGVGLQYLGLIYMLGLSVTIRFLWATLVDKINFSKHGHYKGWLFLTQILIVFSLIGISFCTIQNNLMLIIILITIFSFVAATQYTALDGFVYKTLSKEQRSVGNAVKMAGGMIGAIIGGGFGLVLYANIGWQNTLFIFVGFALFSMVLLFIYNEEETQNKNHLPSIRLRDIFRYWAKKQRRTWLFLMALSPISISVFFGLNARILVDNHWALDKIGFVVNIVGYSIGTIASFFVPLLIDKFSKRNVLYVGLIGQTIGLALLNLVLYGYTSVEFVGFMVVFAYAFYPLMATVIATLMMDNINSNTPAFEYSIQQSVFMLVGLFSAGFSLFLAGFIGYENVIYIGIFLGILALVPARKMDMS